MDTLVITGGCGFIGFNMTAHLMKNFDILLIDNFNDFYDPAIKWKNWELLHEFHKKKNFPTSLELLNYNILDFPINNFHFKEMKCSAVIHLAAQPGVRESFGKEELYHIQNVIGTQKVLEFASNLKAEKFINFSSSSVYGDQSRFPLDESIIPSPISPYGKSKLEAEYICSNFISSSSFPILTLRPFSVYGPQQRPEMVINTFIERIISNQPIFIYGNGNQKRDFTYVSDIVQAVRLCVESNFNVRHHIFNIGNGHPISIYELLEKLSTLLNVDPKVIYQEPKLGDPITTWASLTNVQESLKFHPKVFIDEGLKRVINWKKNHNVNQILI